MELRKRKSKRPVRRILFGLLAIIPIGLGLPGCATSTASSNDAYATPSGAMVYTTDALGQWETEFDRYDALRPEYARNDAVLGRRDVAAITAANQWPQPLLPIERPVEFRNFQQDRSGYGYGYYDRGYDGRDSGRRGDYRRGSERGGYDRYDRRRGGSSGGRGVFRR